MYEQAHGSDIERAAIINTAMEPNSELYSIALEALDPIADKTAVLTPREVADIIMPPKQPGQKSTPRWQLGEDASRKVESGPPARIVSIIELAEQLGMRREESISDEDIQRIDAGRAIWVVESGANKTSVVRRQLAIDGMKKVYGEDSDLSGLTMYQFGLDRKIPEQRTNRAGELIDNPEYKTARQIAGDFLPNDGDLTEFGLNVASALQAGYRIDGQSGPTEHSRQSVELLKQGYPKLVIMQPFKDEGRLYSYDGFTAVSDITDLTGKQFVVATNGQYRPKCELQANRWAADHYGLALSSAVAIGDEAGYTVEHNGAVITTAERQAALYMNEMVILSREQRK